MTFYGARMPDVTSRSWTLLSVKGPRQHGGNAGYDDAPTSTYRFDSGVANSRNVRAGDLAFVRNAEGLLGIAVIERVEEELGDKELLRCPVCRATRIKLRRTASPAYRCNAGHQFDEPVSERVAVTLYEAHYGSTFMRVPAGISAVDLRRAAFRPNPLMSIEEIDAGRIANAVVASAPQTRTLLEQFLQHRFYFGHDAADDDRGDNGDAYTPQMSDRRDRIIAAIKARRGQAKFRLNLLKRYGGACAISGCTVMAIIEAAHIWPYRGEEDNHVENGLLLRADLHTLYDLNLIGIDEELRIHVSSELRGSDYENLRGKQLRIVHKPSASAIRERWQSYVRADEAQSA